MNFFLFLCTAFYLTFFPGTSFAKSSFDVNAVSTGITERVRLHGYYEFEYWSKQGSNSTFDAHKVVAWMGVPVNEMVFLSSEFEYEHFPRLSNGSSKPGGNGEFNLDSAQLRITPLENSTVYMGLFYVPFGVELLSYPGHKNKLITRPGVMKGGGIIPGTWSDVGIGLSHTLDGLGETDIFYVNGDAKNGGISRDSGAGGNDAKSLGVRVMLNRVIDGLNLGASYVRGKHDEAGRLYADRYGAHIRLDLDIITGSSIAPVLITEYVNGKNEGSSSELDGAGNPKDQNVSGFYTQLSSKIFPCIELVARYGSFNNDSKKSDNRKDELSSGVVLSPLKNFLIKGEYHSQWNDEKNNSVIFQAVVNW